MSPLAAGGSGGSLTSRLVGVHAILRNGDGGGGWHTSGLHRLHDSPYEATEFTSQRYLHFLAHFHPGGHLFPFLMQAVLAFPGDLLHGGAVFRWDFGLSLTQLGTHFGRESIVLGTFVDQPASVAVAGFSEATEATFAATAGLAGHESKKGHELAWMGKAVNIAQLGDDDHARDEPKSTQAHHRLYDRFLIPRLHHIGHLCFEAFDALVERR